MKRLVFKPVFSASTERLWQMFSDVKNYPKYIKYCHKAGLIGQFQVGSTWYDWSTVVFVPLKVNHRIVKVSPNRELLFNIDLPFFVSLDQRFILESKGVGTEVNIEITIDFKNKLMEILLGSLIAYRNRKMIEGTISNVQEILKQNDNNS